MTDTAIPRSRSSLAPIPEERADAGDAARAVLILAVLHAMLAAAAFAVLGAVFGFPGILREAGGVVLAAFDQNSGIIRTAYYAFALSSVLLAPIAILLRRATTWQAMGLMDVAAGFGLLAAVTQVLGFARWPLYVPYLAETYVNALPGSATRDGMVLLYEAANRYSGMTVGEHLGWLFQGLWVVCLALAIVRQRDRAAWLGWLGVALGVLLLISSGEQFQAGFEGPLGLLSTIVTTALPFWTIGVGLWLTRRASRAGQAAPGQAAG